MRKLKVGLALSGGGARGFYHIGVLKGLQDLGIKVDIVAGSSIGAIVGGLYALTEDALKVEKALLGILDKYDKHFTTLKNYAAASTLAEKRLFLEKSFNFVKDVYLWNLHIMKTHVVDNKPYFAMIKDLFGRQRFSDCKIPFIITTTDLVAGQVHYVRKGPLVKPIAASAALPGFFPSIRVKGKLLSDGGVLMSMPAQVLNKKGNFVIGVSIDTYWSDTYQVKSAVDTLFHVDKIRHNYIINEGLTYADYLIHPDLAAVSWADFDRAHELIDMGHRAIMGSAKQIKRSLARKRVKDFFVRS